MLGFAELRSLAERSGSEWWKLEAGEGGRQVAIGLTFPVAEVGFCRFGDRFGVGGGGFVDSCGYVDVRMWGERARM